MLTCLYKGRECVPVESQKSETNASKTTTFERTTVQFS